MANSGYQWPIEWFFEQLIHKSNNDQNFSCRSKKYSFTGHLFIMPLNEIALSISDL